MSSNVTKFTCPGYGANVTRRDQWIGVGIMLGATAVLTVAWMIVHVEVGDNPYVDSFSVIPFLSALLLSMPFTYLKGRPLASQFVFIGGTLVLLVAVALLFGFIASLL